MKFLFLSGGRGFMMKVLDVIPVYRSQDNPSKTYKNIDSFLECYKILKEGKCIFMRGGCFMMVVKGF